LSKSRTIKSFLEFFFDFACKPFGAFYLFDWFVGLRITKSAKKILTRIFAFLLIMLCVGEFSVEEKSRRKKKKSTISEVNRAKTRMSSYVKCFEADQSTKLGISKKNYRFDSLLGAFE